LRTASITAAYAVATSALARAGPAAAACHQICFQLWLASSLLADSLAVACQTLLASSLAAGQLEYARQVVRRTTAMAGALGGLLMLGLAASRESLPQLFTKDPAVLALVAWVLPLVIVTQPINAMAFVWDGALYGVGGFKFASVAMAAAALPAMGVMLGGERLLGAVAGPAAGGSLAQAQLTCVWAGLGLLMALRALSIWLPYRLRLPPFRKLFNGEPAAPAGGTA
jgi:Na+-driven multidrug efflux pump